MTLTRWIRATWVGWLAGFPLIILFALLGEVLHIGGAQALVGAGMGAGVGLVQGRALRPMLGRAAPWTWSCVVGLTLAFLLADGLHAMDRESRYEVQLALAIGGIVAGICQAYLLRAHQLRSEWWVLISGLGWTLAAISYGAADGLGRSHWFRGPSGALVYLGITAIGGLLLGATTGVVLVGLVGAPTAGGNPAGEHRDGDGEPQP